MVVWSKIKNFHDSVAAADFMESKQENRSFQQMTAQADAVLNIASGDQPEISRKRFLAKCPLAQLT
jgi:hypothetical protein